MGETGKEGEHSADALEQDEQEQPDAHATATRQPPTVTKERW